MITKNIEKLLHIAHKEALERKHRFLLTEHLLYAIATSNPGTQFLDECDVNLEQLTDDLEIFFQSQNSDQQHLQPITSVMVERIVKRAVEHSLMSGQDVCTVIDVLAAMMKEEDSYAVGLLKKQNLTRLQVMKQSRIFENIENSPSQSNVDEADETVDNLADQNQDKAPQEKDLTNKEQEDKKKKKSGKSPNLSEEKILREFLIDLNEKSRRGKIDPLIGRQQEMERLLLILGRRKKNNPILIGDPGVGKTAIVEGLARGIIEKTVHERFHNYQVYNLEMGSLLAGTKFRGDLEERITRIFSILKKKRHSIVFIDEIHTLVGSGATTGSGLDASNLIKPMLTDGDVQVIGATTFNEYRNHFQKDSALNRRFEKVEVKEPTIPETIEILKSLSTYYSDFHQVNYPEEVLDALPTLCKNYFLEKKLPDGAIDVMDLAGSHTKIRKSKSLRRKISNKLRPVVSLKEVEKLISQMSGIPLRKIEYKSRFRINEVLREIKKQIFGQDHVVESIIKAVKLSKLGLGGSQPIGSFLFTGPTGVGKTELCRVLSQVLNMHLLRLDMSEFMESHSVSKLIGAPPGYIGFNEKSGELTEQINKHPHCLLLLDEIEKAHPDVVNTFLQVMDYGQLTDSSGRRVNFEKTLIVMTSNLGAEEMSSLGMGFAKKSPATDLSKGNNEIKGFFRPEFRNRLNAVLRFNFLSDANIKDIITKLLDEMNQSLTEKGLEVKMEPAVVDYLLASDYDPQMGGRSIKRVFESQIKERVADYVFSQPTGFFKSNNKGKTKTTTPTKTVLLFYINSASSLKIKTV